VLFVLTTIIMIGMGGCMSRSESMDRRMMEYINGRYDDTFTFIERKNFTNSTATSRQILVRSERFPDEYITVRIGTRDGVEFLSDDYLYFVYREQTTAFLEELLADVFEHDFKLFYEDTPSAGVRVLPADATFEEYISNEASSIGFVAVIAPGYDLDRDALPVKMSKAFASHNMMVSGLALRFSNDIEAYKSLTSETLMSYLHSYRGPILWMSMVGRENASIRWRDDQ
jgi:hypothetical protein